MKKLSRKMAAAGISAVLAFGLMGCSGGAAEEASSGKGSAELEAEETGISSVDGLDLEFSKRDMDASFDAAAATKIALADSGISVDGSGAEADGKTVTLNSAGAYLISGALSDGCIVVDAGDEDKLQLVLDGVSIHHESGPALFVSNADKCFITLADGSDNELSDGADYQLEGEDDDRDATIFSKDDLTINGSGALAVTGASKHAICSNDDLVITGGALTVTAAQDALRGKDCIKIADGAITVNAGDDAFHSDAFFYAKGGEITVESCYEGYEGEKVIIDGGNHRITASDDALNAALSDSDPGLESTMPAAPGGGQMAASSSECLIQINGGTVELDAQTDGIDSNGDVEISGGTVLVSGPDAGMDGALDYDMSATVTGGVILMTGAVGNTAGLAASAQSSALVSASGRAGQEVSLVSADGAVLATFSAGSDFSTVLASSPQIAEGEAFSIRIDGAATEAVMGSGLDMAQNGGRGPGGLPGGERGLSAQDGAFDGGQPPQDGDLGEGQPPQDANGGPGRAEGGKGMRSA